MKKILLVFTFFLFSYYTALPQFCFSQSPFWAQTNGPESGSIRCLVKSTSNKWYAGTSGNGVCFSTNEGANWIVSNSGLTNAKINNMAIDSSNNIYAGTEKGFFRSTDNGASWTNIYFMNSVINAVAVDTANRLFVSTGSVLYYSTDYGLSWNITGTGLPSGNSYYNLCIAPNHNMYVHSSSLGVYRSTDGGSNWTAVNSGLPNTNVGTIKAAANNYLFAGISGQGIYLSTNNGDNWTAVNSGLGNMFVNGIGSFGTLIFAATNNGIYKSTNFGTGWTAVNTGFPSPYTGCNCFGFVSGSVIFAGTSALSILKSTNGGDAWFKSGSGINAGNITTITRCTNGNIIVGLTGGVYLSTNNGSTFTQSDAGITNTFVNIIRCHSNGYLFLGSFPMSGAPLSGIFRSTNNGLNWSVAMSGLTYQFNNVLDFTFNSGGDIYAATNDNVYKSTNLGNNWVKTANGITNSLVYSIAVNSQNNFVFAGTYGSGMFRSTTNGADWTQINNGLTSSQIMSLEINSGGYIFAGSNGAGVFRSKDNGDNWEQVLGSTSMVLQAWRIAINRLGHIYAGIVGGQIVNLGVWRSTDNGDNWTQVSDGIFYPFIDALAFDNQDYAFAGSLGGGLYKSVSSTPVISGNIEIPKSFSLEQNYPNPFNPVTTIKFQIPEKRYVSIKIINSLGKEIAELINGNLSAGQYSIQWNASQYPSGVYFCSMQSGIYKETKRMMLVK